MLYPGADPDGTWMLLPSSSVINVSGSRKYEREEGRFTVVGDHLLSSMHAFGRIVGTVNRCSSWSKDWSGRGGSGDFAFVSCHVPTQDV